MNSRDLVLLKLIEAELGKTILPTLSDNTDDPVHQIFNREYTVTTTATDGNTTDLARGWAEIEMRFVSDPSPQWVITRWTDHVISGVGPNPTDPCLNP